MRFVDRCMCVVLCISDLGGALCNLILVSAVFAELALIFRFSDDVVDVVDACVVDL